MAVSPTTRATFKDYCLRKLGSPVIKINLSDDQIDDRISEAISYWRDYHYNATERVFLKHVITEQDKTNKYVTVPENVIEVIRIIDSGFSVGGSPLTNVKYQFMLQNVNSITNQSIVPYYAAMRHLELLDDMLGDKFAFRFNRHSDKLYIDTDWSDLTVGKYIIFETYTYLDPNEVSEMWGSWWLQRYATLLIKQNWGEVLNKFGESVQLMGGITYNGAQILSEAKEGLEKMEEEMLDKYTLPPMGQTQ